ncbi:MAG TPA: hypothetical protein VFL41_10305 [Gaiellaceae bacterium]|nr:hypothetical protein [Gaiellaceae bacterium]
MRQSDLGGVPCFYASAPPPPFAATLIFRVGRVDETFRTSGMTHLAEHLLMPTEPPAEFERNARVEVLYAVFWASGLQDEVLRFLTDTCAAIEDPALDRIETERQILETEAAGRSWGPVDGTIAMRFGLNGAGIVGSEEIALAWAGPGDVRDWLRRYLTAGNAVCWMTGRPPAGFRLALPPGGRIDPPDSVALPQVETPAAYDDGPPGQVHLALEGERSTALVAGLNILHDRVWRVLRYERGLAYEIGHSYDPLSAKRAHAVLWVDSLEQNVDSAATALLELFDDLCTNGPKPEELAEEARGARRGLEDVLRMPGILHVSACEELLGREYSPEDLVREKEALQPRDVAEALARARESLLLILPEGARRPSGFSAYPMSSAKRVEGRRFSLKSLPLSKAVRRTALVVGDDGISFEGDDGSVSTVLFDECVGMTRWADGSRTAYGRDGFRVFVDPTAWRGGKDIVRFLDERLPDELVVTMEPDLEEHVERVQHLAGTKLDRRWTVSDELKALPTTLERSEVVLTIAEADRGWRTGLLAVTDQRVLWFYADKADRTLSLARGEISSVRSSPGTRGLASAKVRLVHDDEELEFTGVEPRERASEIEELLSRGGDA